MQGGVDHDDEVEQRQIAGAGQDDLSGCGHSQTIDNCVNLGAARPKTSYPVSLRSRVGWSKGNEHGQSVGDLRHPPAAQGDSTEVSEAAVVGEQQLPCGEALVPTGARGCVQAMGHRLPPGPASSSACRPVRLCHIHAVEPGLSERMAATTGRAPVDDSAQRVMW